MRYIVDVNGEPVTVELDAAGIIVDGERVAAHIAEVEGTPMHLVTLGAAIHRIAVTRGDSRGRYAIWTDGYRFEVEALDERTRAIREMSGAGSLVSGPISLRAPMPGLIVRVNVRAGDSVQPGQGLVVMEAMKMENELRSTAAGTVRAVLVEVGAAVEKGATLIELE